MTMKPLPHDVDKVIMWLEARRAEYLKRATHDDEVAATELGNVIKGLEGHMHRVYYETHKDDDR